MSTTAAVDFGIIGLGRMELPRQLLRGIPLVRFTAMYDVNYRHEDDQALPRKRDNPYRDLEDFLASGIGPSW